MEGYIAIDQLVLFIVIILIVSMFIFMHIYIKVKNLKKRNRNLSKLNNIQKDEILEIKTKIAKKMLPDKPVTIIGNKTFVIGDIVYFTEYDSEYIKEEIVYGVVEILSSYKDIDTGVREIETRILTMPTRLYNSDGWEEKSYSDYYDNIMYSNTSHIQGSRHITAFSKTEQDVINIKIKWLEERRDKL